MAVVKCYTFKQFSARRLCPFQGGIKRIGLYPGNCNSICRIRFNWGVPVQNQNFPSVLWSRSFFFLLSERAVTRESWGVVLHSSGSCVGLVVEFIKNFGAAKGTVAMWPYLQGKVEKQWKNKVDEWSVLCFTQRIGVSNWLQAWEQSLAPPGWPWCCGPPRRMLSAMLLESFKQLHRIWLFYWCCFPGHMLLSKNVEASEKATLCPKKTLLCSNSRWLNI